MSLIREASGNIDKAQIGVILSQGIRRKSEVLLNEQGSVARWGEEVKNPLLRSLARVTASILGLDYRYLSRDIEDNGSKARVEIVASGITPERSKKITVWAVGLNEYLALYKGDCEIYFRGEATEMWSQWDKPTLYRLCQFNDLLKKVRG